jgi:hypothetical protein
MIRLVYTIIHREHGRKRIAWGPYVQSFAKAAIIPYTATIFSIANKRSH